MPLTQSSYEVVSRDALISRLRKMLMRRAGPDKSICQLATQQGIFCKGFGRFTERELRDRIGWLVRKRPEASRQELEGVTDSWQLARQEASGLPTACDVQSVEHDLCNGWGDFSSEELAGFYHELTAKHVIVVTS